MSDGSVLTLDQFLEFGIRHNIEDPRIYEYLTGPIDQAAIDEAVAKIDEINNRPKPSGMSAKSFESLKNQLKGDEFEKLVGLVLKTVKPFEAWNKVPTPLNELDWLVLLGPTANYHPSIREWGTHFICECKFGAQTVSVTWIGKLNTVLETHSATVGLLMSSKGIAKKGRSSAVRYQLQMLAAKTPSRIIVCLNTEEIRSSLADRKFLQLITRRYVEAKVGAAPLRTIA
jgi:hypothetical protein